MFGNFGKILKKIPFEIFKITKTLKTRIEQTEIFIVRNRATIPNTFPKFYIGQPEFSL